MEMTNCMAMPDGMGMHGMGWMMAGAGLLWLVWLILGVLGVVALIKYIFPRKPRADQKPPS